MPNALLPVVIALAAALPAEEPAATPPAGTGDWYCVGYDAGHSYTSPDIVPTPLKLRWMWQPPANEGQVQLLQVVSSDGKVIVHGRHSNKTPIGERTGSHNWIVDLRTGVSASEDPAGTTPNDTTFGHPIGSYGGAPYQCDDGGPPFGGCDVWSPVQISASEQFWAVVQQSKIDGPDPGIYCMHVGKPIGSGWFSGTKASGSQIFCRGDVAIAGGRLFATTAWTLQGADLVNGLACYDLSGGKRQWKLDGKFAAVSATKDWCVAVDERKALVLISPADGKVAAVADIPALPECPVMITEQGIGLYDESGGFTRYRISDKNGKASLASAGHVGIGRFAGPRVVGRYNCPFCFGADGTIFVANGDGVSGSPADKKGKSWSWSLPPEAHGLGPLGGAIIARGKLVVLGTGGVLCFDAEGAPNPAKK
jgi:hypothetical protein